MLNPFRDSGGAAARAAALSPRAEP
eukprot:COSAG04_NODE_8556_length_958_cov_1.167637_2_plen_24_part_01